MLEREFTGDNTEKNILDFFLELFSSWPEYVVSEWIFRSFKHSPSMLHQYIDQHPDILDITWERKEIFITIDDFDDWSRSKLNPSSFSYSFDDISNNIEKMLQINVNPDPIIVFKVGDKYKLVDGWQRTMNNFKMLIDGYPVVAYIGTTK